MAYLNIGQYQQAIEDSNKAIELDPRAANAYFNRALGYTFLGMDDQARADIEQAVSLGVDRETIEGQVEMVKEIR